MALLAGPLHLADDLFLLLHDPGTGTPRVHQRAIQVGLAAALTGELILTGNVTVQDEYLVVMDRRPPADAVAHVVLDRLVAVGQPCPVGIWLRHLGPDAVPLVGTRLVRTGLLRHRPKRWYRDESWRPIDPAGAGWPAVRLNTLFKTRGPVTVQDAGLAGLALGCGLPGWMVGVRRGRSWEYLTNLLSELPMPLRELIAVTEMVTDSA